MKCKRLRDVLGAKDVECYRQSIKYSLNGSNLYVDLYGDGLGDLQDASMYDDYYKPEGCNICRDEGCEVILDVLEVAEENDIIYDRELNKEYPITGIVNGEEVTVTSIITDNEVEFIEYDEYCIEGYYQVDDGLEKQEQYYTTEKLEKGDVIITSTSNISEEEVVLNYEPSLNSQTVKVKLVAIDKPDENEKKRNIINKWLVL
ncbi:MAG: hypothetical protein SOV21_00140 [Methanosphaera sp.]|nr:hypothetical protein [Methanosphaera sp.]